MRVSETRQLFTKLGQRSCERCEAYGLQWIARVHFQIGLTVNSFLVPWLVETSVALLSHECEALSDVSLRPVDSVRKLGKKKVKTQKQENTSFASSLLLITFKLMPICAMPQNHPCAHLRFAQAPSQGSCTAWCKSSRWSQSGAHAFWWFVLIRPVVSCGRKAPVYRHASTGYWYVMVCIVQTEYVKILVVCLFAWVIASMYLEEKTPNTSLPDTTHRAS